MKRLIPLLGIGFLLAGCPFLEQFRQMAVFTKCQFRLVSVADTALIGVPLAGKRGVDDFGYREAAKFALASKDRVLPLTFTLNVEVKNPNASPAGMNRLEWILLVDGVEMTRGAVNERVEVPANGTAPLALAMAFDLGQVLSGQSLEAMIRLAFNVAGEGTKPSRVTLKAKPSILVGGQMMDFPDYITVTAEYGGGAPAQ